MFRQSGTSCKNLLGFFMNRVLAIELAEFFNFEATGSISFFLGARIVSAFTLGAFQNNNFTHFNHLACLFKLCGLLRCFCREFSRSILNLEKADYSTISLTRPEATVRPPSRIAKRWVFSIAIGAISSTLIATLSPGITIWTSSGRVMIPVTSVVLK